MGSTWLPCWCLTCATQSQGGGHGGEGNSPLASPTAALEEENPSRLLLPEFKEVVVHGRRPASGL